MWGQAPSSSWFRLPDSPWPLIGSLGERPVDNRKVKPKESSQMRSYTLFLGVDISKATFDVVCRTPEGENSRAQTFANTPAGCAAFCQAFPLADSLMVVEATGGYETALIRSRTRPSRVSRCRPFNRSRSAGSKLISCS